jgi:hypothetical protein
MLCSRWNAVGNLNYSSIIDHQSWCTVIKSFRVGTRIFHHPSPTLPGAPSSRLHGNLWHLSTRYQSFHVTLPRRWSQTTYVRSCWNDSWLSIALKSYREVHCLPKLSHNVLWQVTISIPLKLPHLSMTSSSPAVILISTQATLLQRCETIKACSFSFNQYRSLSLGRPLAT